MWKRFYLVIVPVVYLVWPIIYFLAAFIAPHGNLGKLALATVKSNNTDGLQIWMGVSGSCARLNYSTPITCTKGHYDLSSIRPSNHTAREYSVIPFEVAKPNTRHYALIIISLISSILLWVLLVAKAVYYWTRDKTDLSTLLDGLTFLFLLLNTIGPGVFMFILVAFLQAGKIFNLEAKQVGNTEFIAKSDRLMYTIIGFGHPLFVTFVTLCSVYVNSKLKSPNPIPPLPPLPPGIELQPTLPARHNTINSQTTVVA